MEMNEVDLGLSEKLTQSQPFEEAESEEKPEETKSWGKLIPLIPLFPIQVLTMESYTFGRSNSCEYEIESHFMSDYEKISKCHFSIFRKVLDSSFSVTYLKDFSRNGTFVNGLKIGNKEETLLKNCDEIALLNSNNKIFMYIEENSCEAWLPPEIRPHYQVLKHLGTGAFAEVKLVVNKKFHLFAMKKVLKSHIHGDRIYNEIKILQRISHPCIISLKDVVETPEAIFINLEYMVGGDLRSKIMEAKKLSEPETKNILYQLVIGLSYLHGQGITHRDIKAENVLLASNKKLIDVQIKVADFGLAKILDSSTNLKSHCGTLLYVAPEVLYSDQNLNYTNAVDIWSLGVLLYLCLSGSFPFESDSKYSLICQIVKGSFKINTPQWFSTSANVKNLIKRMLNVSPERRISLDMILKHEWFKDHEVLPSCRMNLIDENKNFVANSE